MILSLIFQKKLSSLLNRPVELMPKTIYKNDGKNKYQSEELHFNLKLDNVKFDVYGEIDFVLYGENRDEVNEKYKIFIDRIITELTEIKNTIK